MKIELKNEMFKMGVLAALIVVAMPELAIAQTVGDMAETVTDTQMPFLTPLISAAGYIIGAILMLSGALSLKKHSENPASEPLGKGLGRLIIGALITSLPALLSTIQGSTGFQESGGVAYKTLNTNF